MSSTLHLYFLVIIQQNKWQINNNSPITQPTDKTLTHPLGVVVGGQVGNVLAAKPTTLRNMRLGSKA